MRVLITDISSYKAVVIARFLQLAYPELDIVATDHRPFVKHIHTRWVERVNILPSGPDNPGVYVEAISSLIRQRQIDFLIPVNSKEIRLLMENRIVLGATLDYVGRSELYTQLDDKAAFGALLQEAGVPAPQARPSIDAQLPLVVKPTRGSSSKGICYLLTDVEREAFRAIYGAAPKDCVIQDYFEGEGIGYSGFFRDGKIIVGYAHRRVAEYPVTGGSSVVREDYPYGDLQELVSLVEKVLAKAPWSGFAMFEMKRRSHGDFGFIECNPRIWGSVHQGLSNGANYFVPLLGLATHQQPARNVRTALFPLNLVSFLGYSLRGKFKLAKQAVGACFTAKLDVNPLTDPLGFAALLRRGA